AHRMERDAFASNPCRHGSLCIGCERGSKSMSASMSWLILVVAGVLEAFWAVGLKYTEGFTKLWPSVIVGIAIVASMGLLGVAARNLPISTAYPVWVGIGTFGAVSYGIFVLKE